MTILVTNRSSDRTIDTHVHCFAGRDEPTFPYHPDAPYQSAQPATPEHLLKCMDGAGVDFAVIAHPEPYQDDHRYLEHCPEVGNWLRGCSFSLRCLGHSG